MNPGGILGYDHALVLDAQGRPHVVYEDLPGAAGTSGLKYAVRTAGTWQTSLVDPALGAYDCAIALDGAGRPHVAYLSRFTNLLTYAAPNGAAWTRETAASSPGLGFGLSLEVQAACRRSSTIPPRTASATSRGARRDGSPRSSTPATPASSTTPPSAWGTLHVAYHDRRNVYLVHGRSIQLSDPPWALPTVALTSPANGAFLLGVLIVSAAPYSAAGILRVEFEVDGALRHVDATAPYTFAWNASEVGTVLHTLTARAVDATGARVEHSVQVYGVNVRPDAN